jgi:hypothetical protein
MQTLRLLRAQGEREYQIYMGVVILACGDPALDLGFLTAGSPLREDDNPFLSQYHSGLSLFVKGRHHN